MIAEQYPSRREGVEANRSAGVILAALLFVYILNFADRVLLGVMAVPIKADLGLSDTQLGLLGGTAFALFYSTLGIPIGWLADRKSRSWIVTIALVIWSGCTALCGMASNFVTLFLARVGVGVGEAGGIAPSYSLISDYFPPHQRARALGIYSFGIPIGSALGLAFGGLIATQFDWRAAFLFMGLLGIAVAPLFKWIVKDPPRGGLDRAPVIAPVGLSETFRRLRSKPSFWLISLGSAMSATASYGISFWIPSFYVRSFGMSLATVSYAYAAMLLFGGVAGTWIGAWLGDRFGPTRPAAYLLIPIGALLASLPFFIAAISVQSAALSLLLMTIPTALGGMGFGTVLTAIQHVVPPSLRSSGSATFLFINNLIGLGVGSALLGLISDALTRGYGEESLRYALLAGTGFYLLAVLFYWLASRRVQHDWEA